MECSTKEVWILWQSEELEKRELQITLCEAKNAQFVQELVEQQKLIIKLKRQVEDTEKYSASNIHKVSWEELDAMLSSRHQIAIIVVVSS